MKKNKICGFSQLRNELSKGNLENWFKCMSVCDYIYVFDQNSDDGSKEYYKQFPNCVVIESPINDFENELICKDILLQKLLTEHPDTNWIMWLDGDSFLTGGLEKREQIEHLLSVIPENIDGVDFDHYNMWRSTFRYRIDNLYDYFNKTKRTVFWRNNGKLKFPHIKGLHNQENERPIGIENRLRVNHGIIHMGFATEEQIFERYKINKEKNVSGYNLDRLLDESTLETNVLTKKHFPSWFKITDYTDPKDKPKLIDLINSKII